MNSSAHSTIPALGRSLVYGRTPISDTIGIRSITVIHTYLYIWRMWRRFSVLVRVPTADCIVTAVAAPWRQSAWPSRGLSWYARLQILPTFWRCQDLRVAVGQVSVASTTIWWAYLVPHPPPISRGQASTTPNRNGRPRGLTH